jgi:hypothetical protein
MIFENVEICVGDDVANAVLCNYNPYFMGCGWCFVMNADSAGLFAVSVWTVCS